MKVEYRSNNSGGSFWLDDEDWEALEKAGWYVPWGGEYFCHSSFSWMQPPADKPVYCESAEDCPGHRKAESREEAKQYEWLGTLAREASKDFATIQEAMREFEKLTGEDVTDEGCNCCGAPHNFSWTDAAGEHQYASGQECVSYLVGDRYAGVSLREALEQLATKEAVDALTDVPDA